MGILKIENKYKLTIIHKLVCIYVEVTEKSADDQFCEVYVGTTKSLHGGVVIFFYSANSNLVLNAIILHRFVIFLIVIKWLISYLHSNQ